MPKNAFYTLTWSSSPRAYELYSGQRDDALDLILESPAWSMWVSQLSSFAFHGQHGSYTARKERRRRGEYWYAYARVEGKLTKRYLGRSTDLTLTRLEQVAQELWRDPQAALCQEEARASSRPPSHTSLDEKVFLFLVLLDEQRGWFRCHPLVAEVLRQRLQQTAPILLPELLLRASRWYAQPDCFSEAVSQALTAGAFEEVARLLQQPLATCPEAVLPGQPAPALVEPLTARERDVLRLLLREGASNRQIAQQLVLSINTVKKHLANLYGKLNVQSRAQAIVQAHRLQLV